MKPTYNRKTVLYFDSKESRESAIDFLLKLNIPFTYINALPLIGVRPSDFKKHCLDLYLTGIVGLASTFKYRKQYIHS